MMFGLFGNRRKRSPGIDEKTPLNKARYVVLDTELTGLDEKRDSIVSIGAVRIAEGRIGLGDVFYRLVSPKTALHADSVVIHEITPSEVATEPAIDAVLADFLEYCGTDILVGHFISIDLSFLNREMKRMYGRKLANEAIDTFSIYKWLRKRRSSRHCFETPLAGCRLHDMVKCFGIPVSGGHNALMDAFAAAQLLQRFFPALVEAGARDVGELLKIGIPFEGGDGFELTGEFINF